MHAPLRRQSPFSAYGLEFGFGSAHHLIWKLYRELAVYVQSVIIIIVACDGEEVKLACVWASAQIETSHAALGESICIISGAGGATSGAHSGQQNLRVDLVHAALHVELARRSALTHLKNTET